MLSEPGNGSDAGAASTRAEATGATGDGGWRLNGTKVGWEGWSRVLWEA